MGKSTTTSFNHQTKMILLVALLLLVGCAVFYLATPFGIGIRHDSLGYFEVAENLAAGNGLIFNDGSPLRQWAPMYPSMLAITAKISGVEMAGAAWWLNGFLFLLSSLVLAWCVARYLGTNHFRVAFGITWLAFIFTADMLEMYTVALSEAAFITATLCGTFFALRYAGQKRPFFDLLALSIFFTLAVTIRFMGLFLLLPALFAIWILTSATLKQKFKATILFLAIFLPPVGWWLWRSRHLTGSAGGNIAYYTQTSLPLPNIKHVQQALLHSSAWFLPEAIPVIPRVILFGLLGLLLVGLMLRQWRRSGRPFLSRPQWLLMAFALIFIGSYTTALVGSMFTIAIGITPTERYLAPLVPYAMMVLAVVLTKLIESVKMTSHRRFIRPALAILFLAYLSVGTLTVQGMHQEGVGHITRTIMNSQLIASVKNLPADTVLYSNEAPRLEVILGRKVALMPLRERYFQKVKPERYQHQFEAMTADLTQNNGYIIVMLDISAYERQILDLEYFLNHPQITIVKQFEDGYILQTKPQ